MYIVVGSVTTATRLARILEKRVGIPASVAHTPSAIKSGGCSYSVRINDNALGAARRVVDEYGINIKGMYKEEISGREREYRDIS